jgi:hypothetical protein
VRDFVLALWENLDEKYIINCIEHIKKLMIEIKALDGGYKIH